MQHDPNLYFSVLPRDFLNGYLNLFIAYKPRHRVFKSASWREQMAFDNNGELLAPNKIDHLLVRYNVETGCKLSAKEYHSYPVACAVDEENNVYVAVANAVVSKRSIEGIAGVEHMVVCGNRLIVGTYGGVRGIYIADTRSVGGLAVLSTQQIVVSYSCGDICIYNLNGEQVCGFKGRGGPIAVDSVDNIYILDYEEHYIQVVTSSGVKICLICLYTFEHPTSIAHYRGTIAVRDIKGIHILK